MFKKFIGDRAFYRRVFAVMVPVLIQNVITNFVNLLDNIMVGRVGTEPMSGVAIVNQLIFVYNLCLFAAVAAGGIYTAQYYGKGDHEGVRATTRLKLWFVIGVTVIAYGVLFLFGDKFIMNFLHEGDEGLDLTATFGYAKDYLKVIYFQMVPFAVIQVYSGTLRDTGETVVPMRAGIIAVLVNMVLNYILIYGKLGLPALGVTGAAIATVIARITECLIIVIYAHTRKNKTHFTHGLYKTMKVPATLLKKVVVMGMPLLVNELMWSTGMTILNQCYSLRGLEVVSATNISSTISNLFFCSYMAMGSTISIMVGQCLGSGDLEKAVDEDRKLIAFSVMQSIAVGIILAAFSPLLPELYNTTEGVKKLASQLIFVSACMIPFLSFTNSCYFTLRSGGKTIITFIFDGLYVWAAYVPAAFILSHYTNLPILQMYIVVQILDVLRCFLGFYFVKSRRWVNNLVK